MTQLPQAEANTDMHADDEALALHALGWILSDETRAERLLGLTGLAPDDLRASLGNRTTLAAILTFLTAHEADLVACAAELDVAPAMLAVAAARLDGGDRADA